MSNSLRPHGLQHTRLPCPWPTPRTCSNSCPLSLWCHPVILSSVAPFFSCLKSFPASGSFVISQLFASGGQSIGVSASAWVLPMNIQGLFPLGFTDLISLLSEGLSRVFTTTTAQKHQFFSAQHSLISLMDSKIKGDKAQMLTDSSKPSDSRLKCWERSPGKTLAGPLLLLEL